MTSIRIADVMTSEVLSVEPSLPFEAAIALMDEHRVSCVPVAESGRPVGVISERDVLQATGRLRKGVPLPSRTDEVMSKPPITILADSSVDEAIAVVNQRRIRRLVVVDQEERLVGLVTQTDLVTAQTMALARERDLLEERVKERTIELEAVSRRLEELSLADPLLGIGNRRAMEREMERLHELAKRYQRVYGVLMLDIDQFKQYNDHYGHPVADGVLRNVARAAEAALRTSDSIYRYGGEELLVCLPETGPEGTATAAERLRQTIEALAIPHEFSTHGVVTVSIGGAFESGIGELGGWETRISQADEALYRAKEAGRNRTCLYED